MIKMLISYPRKGCATLPESLKNISLNCWHCSLFNTGLGIGSKILQVLSEVSFPPLLTDLLQSTGIQTKVCPFCLFRRQWKLAVAACTSLLQKTTQSPLSSTNTGERLTSPTRKDGVSLLLIRWSWWKCLANKVD